VPHTPCTRMSHRARCAVRHFPWAPGYPLGPKPLPLNAQKSSDTSSPWRWWWWWWWWWWQHQQHQWVRYQWGWYQWWCNTSGSGGGRSRGGGGTRSSGGGGGGGGGTKSGGGGRQLIAPWCLIPLCSLGGQPISLLRLFLAGSLLDPFENGTPALSPHSLSPAPCAFLSLYSLGEPAAHPTAGAADASCLWLLHLSGAPASGWLRLSVTRMPHRAWRVEPADRAARPQRIAALPLCAPLVPQPRAARPLRLRARHVPRWRRSRACESCAWTRASASGASRRCGRCLRCARCGAAATRRAACARPLFSALPAR
jgi:hypothetical protein